MLNVPYEFYIVISSQETELKKQVLNGSNLGSSLSLVQTNFNIVLWEKEKKTFVNKMNMHLKTICKIQDDFQFLESKGYFLLIIESSSLKA